MNIAQLECFVNIASTMNFMKTAELMSLTQPAVSRQIQTLEQELGVRLLDRTTRSVSLTPVGARFLPEAKDILKTYYHSRSWLSSYSMTEQNILRIGYSDPHGINLISRTLAVLKADHPHLNPRFTIDQTDANLARLERGQLDFIVGMKDYTYQNKDVVFMELIKETFTCVVRKDHPLAEIGKDRDIITDDFWPYSQILAIPPYLLVNNHLNRHPFLPVNDHVVNYNCSNNAEAYGLILAGFGFCMVPGHLLMPHPELSFLRWKTSPEAPMGIYYRRGFLKENPVMLDYVKETRRFYQPQIKAELQMISGARGC